MSLQPVPVSLDDLSPLVVRFGLVRTPRGHGWDILVVTFAGRCRPEPEGRLDDRFLHAMAEAGLAAWEPGGIVLDLSGLECGPGDWFGWAGTLHHGGPYLPLAIVVGPGSEGRFREHLDRVEGNSRFGAFDWVYRDRGSALAHVDREVEEEWSEFCGPASKKRREARGSGS